MEQAVSTGAARRASVAGTARAVHPFPSVLLAVLSSLLGLIASGGDEVGRATLLGLTMLCFQFSIGLTNDVVDAGDDALAKPWKPVASGALPRNVAIALAAGFALGGLLLGAWLGWKAWLIGAGGLSCGLVYDLWLKRSVWSWVPYAVAFPLVPAWAYTAVGAWDDRLWWAFPVGGLLGIALHLANVAPDAEADRAAGVRGAAQRLGPRWAARLALVCFGVAAVVTASVVASERTGLGAAVAGVGAVAVVAGMRLPGFLGRDGLFEVLGTGCAGMTVLFLASL
jgi:4-hydroxybenzoate polyprenyltransferase